MDDEPLDDLVAWLRAQLDEDEREAQRAIQALASIEALGYPARSDRFTRVIADIEAKRAILDAYAPAVEDASPFDEIAGGRLSMLDQVLRLLASAYRDRPDYQDAWSPAS